MKKLQVTVMSLVALVLLSVSLTLSYVSLDSVPAGMVPVGSYAGLAIGLVAFIGNLALIYRDNRKPAAKGV